MNSLSFQIRASCLFGALVLSALAQAKVESVVILPQGQNFASHGANAVSLPGLHALLRSPKGSRQVYLFDGVEGQRFDQVTDPSHKAISRDGKRYAYSVFVGTDVILVLDGKEIARAPANGSLNPFPSPLFGFSPTGKRFWYVTAAEAGGVHKLVVDGVASDPTNGISQSPVFSPDESRYVAMIIKQEILKEIQQLRQDGQMFQVVFLILLMMYVYWQVILCHKKIHVDLSLGIVTTYKLLMKHI